MAGGDGSRRQLSNVVDELDTLVHLQHGTPAHQYVMF